MVRQVTYRLPVPADRSANLAERITNLLSTTECWIERTRPQPRRLDLRPYLTALRLGPQGLEMDLRVTPTGTARPEEVLRSSVWPTSWTKVSSWNGRPWNSNKRSQESGVRSQEPGVRSQEPAVSRRRRSRVSRCFSRR